MYQVEKYEHYHDHGDDAPPTIEWAVFCTTTYTRTTGFKNEEEAREWADKMNYDQ